MFRCHLRFTLCLLFVLVLFLPSVSGESVKELNRRGLNEMRAGNYKEAAALIKQALQADKNYAESYLNYFRLLKAVKKPADGPKYLIKAYELDPKNSEIREEYVKLLKEDLEALLKKGSVDQQIAQQKRIFDIDPGQQEMAARVVKHHYENQEFATAKAYAQKALEANRSELAKYSSSALGEIFYFLALMEFEDKELKLALEHADKATRYPLEDTGPAKELHRKIKAEFKQMVDEYLSAGKALAAKGEGDKAIEEFKKGLALDGENEAIQQEIEAINYQKQGKEFYKEAMQLVEGEKWLEARDKLEIVLRFSPKDGEARKALAKAEKFEEDLMKKLGKAERLPRSSSGRASMADGFLRMGRRFLDEKNYKEAKVSLDRCVALAEIDSRLESIKAEAQKAMSEIAEVDSAKKAWDDAREKYKDQDFEECLKLLDQLPDDYAVDLQSYYAFCHWKLKNTDKAKQYAHLQLSKQGDNNRAKFVLASILLESGNNSDAYKLATEIKESDGEYPGIDDLLYKSGAMSWGPFIIPVLILGVMLYIAYLIHSNLPEYYKNAGIKQGKYYLNKGMYQECIEELTKVRKMLNVTAYDGAVISRILAQCYLKCAAYEKAVGECKHLLSINDKDPEVHQWMGFAYLGRRLVSPESLPELLNLYKTERKNVALVGLLGSHYTAQKKLAAEGVEVLEQWYDMEPNNPDLLKSLGRHYLQKGRSDDRAMKVFETMMSSGHRDSSFLLGVAKLHLRMNNFEPCLKICEQILTEEVNNELVHPILREAYRKMGKIPDLLEIYKVFLSENPYNVAFQKGLTECQKLMQQGGTAPTPEAAASAVPGFDAPTLKENEVLCPSCGKVSPNTDYYCQHCGNSISQG